MRRINDRLTKIERRRVVPGRLPTIFVVPADGPERAQVLADVARRRAKGQNILAIGEQDDPLAALVEVFAP